MTCATPTVLSRKWPHVTLVLAMALLVASTARGQVRTPDESAGGSTPERIGPVVRQGSAWVPTAFSSPDLHASIARAAGRLTATEAFRQSSGVNSQANPPQPKSNWIRRHPKLFGALVGFGIGCPIGAAQVGGSEDDFFNTLDEWACPFLGGVGAALGAGLGAALSR